MNERLALENLNILGQKYTENLLNPNNKNPESDWWSGLDFFFSKTFNRGRRDELSLKYFTFTKKILSDRYQIEKGDIENSYQLLNDDFNSSYLEKSIILNFKERHGISPRANSIPNPNFHQEVANNNPLVQSFIAKHTS